MANINIENLVNTCNDNENYNIKNFENIPTSWIKCGEMFYNNLEQAIFVCSICLKNADGIKNAFTTNDVSAFWWHIQQQHISVECETIDKISEEIENFEKNNVVGQIPYDETNSNIAEHIDFNADKMKQNQINVLEEFHENLVKRNNIKEPEEILQNLDIKIELEELHDQNPEPYAKEVNSKEDIKVNKLEENKKYGSNFTNCNYYYDDTETYTISDDEDEQEDEDEEALSTEGEIILRNYLKHNDMIEISDDESSDDNVETRPNTPTIHDEPSVISEGVDEVENNKCTKLNDIKESTLPRASSVNLIPTPDMSPCESLREQHENTNSNSPLQNYTQSKQVKRFYKKKAKSFRAFQCQLCGIRTVNEINMHTHIKKVHKPVFQESAYNQHFHMSYHQIYQSDQDKHDASTQKYVIKNVRPFNCKSCKAKTKTIKAMERHQLLHHSPDTLLLTEQCKLCHKRIRKTNFQQHMQLHFSARFNCTYCGAVYKQKHCFKRHITSHHADINLNSVSENSQQLNMNNMPLMSYAAISIPAILTPEQDQLFRHPEHAQIWGHYMYTNNTISSQNPF